MKIVDKLDFEMEEPDLTQFAEEILDKPNLGSVVGKIEILAGGGVLLAEFRPVMFEHVPKDNCHRAHDLSTTIQASGKAIAFRVSLMLTNGEYNFTGTIGRNWSYDMCLSSNELILGATLNIGAFSLGNMAEVG